MKTREKVLFVLFLAIASFLAYNGVLSLKRNRGVVKHTATSTSSMQVPQVALPVPSNQERVTVTLSFDTSVSLDSNK